MNTSEQLKAEAIKKAWIAEIGEESFNKISPDENGWYFYQLNEYRQLIKGFSPRDMQVEYRPKSLSGIETNNGWTRIEPDGGNLPKIEGDYLFYNNRNERFYLKDFDPKIHGVKTYTHYKLLDFKSPIY